MLAYVGAVLWAHEGHMSNKKLNANHELTPLVHFRLYISKESYDQIVRPKVPL